MGRTAARPIPAGLVPAPAALVWGLLLATLGAIQLALTVNWLAAVWALAAVLFYVGVYTVWLKRTTVQNIVIGGAAGAVPPLVGWAAVTESVDVAPALLFLIVFLWTPPHFWALALRYKHEYARVGVPMLPVVRGDAETKRQIVRYAALLGLASLLLPLSGDVSWLYLGCAAALGLAFLAQARRLQRGRIAPMALFFLSIVYLPLLFLAAMADALHPLILNHSTSASAARSSASVASRSNRAAIRPSAPTTKIQGSFCSRHSVSTPDGLGSALPSAPHTRQRLRMDRQHPRLLPQPRHLIHRPLAQPAAEAQPHRRQRQHERPPRRQRLGHRRLVQRRIRLRRARHRGQWSVRRRRQRWARRCQRPYPRCRRCRRHLERQPRTEQQIPRGRLRPAPATPTVPPPSNGATPT